MNHWILSKLSAAVKTCNEALKQYNFQDSTTAVYNFWLYDLCDVYLVSPKKPHYPKHLTSCYYALLFMASLVSYPTAITNCYGSLFYSTW